MSTPHLDVFAPNFLSEQDNLLNAARERNPIATSERGIEILTYAECRKLLRERRVQKDHMALIELVGLTDPEVLAYKRRVLVGQGLDANRDRMRSVLSRAVSVRKMEQVRADVRSLIEEILDNVVADEPIDFIDQIATLIPSAFFCKWAGLPLEDARLVSHLSSRVLKIFRMDPNYAQSIQEAYTELFAYMDRRLDMIPEEEGGGFLSHLMHEQQQGNVYPTEVRDWVIFALEGSIDNTVHQIGLLLGRLLETPNLWEQIRHDVTLVPPAVEESLRLDSRVRAIHRLAAEDIEMVGVTVPAGTDLFFWIRAAHLDPRAFDLPERFDINRPKKPGPLLFGSGPYSCLGQWMARVEAQETLHVVTERFPNIQLAGVFERSIDLFSLAADRLPVVLDA